MNVLCKSFVAMVTAAALVGCMNTDATFLVFGQQQTVGIAIGGSTTDQGAELSLGYRDRNIAVIPVAINPMGSNTTHAVESVGTDECGNRFTDSHSVLGQFEVNTKAGTGAAEVGLGKFFATGLAARVLAEGFADRLGGTASADSMKDDAKGDAKDDGKSMQASVTNTCNP